MIKNLLFKTILCISLFLMVYTPADSCTSAIFTGKVNKDGKPVMWKHRDTGEENNRIEYFKGPKYIFYSLVNSPLKTDKKGNRIYEAWSGSNEAGFCIMNTASYNLKDDNIPESQMDNEGVVMFKALGTCKNLADFEKMLDNYEKPMGVETNFGVIDSEGGAAYYEVSNTGWTKIDVNDPKIAPQGYLVYTNHSYTGRKDEGMGYIRYTTADNIIKKRLSRGGEITPRWIFDNLSRSFYHSLLDKDLKNENFEWFIDQDFIPRKSSTAVVVFKGEETPVMWTLLGYPPTAPAVPLCVKAGEEGIPSFMRSTVSLPDKISSKESVNKKDKKFNAPICDLSLEVKKEVFPVKRGNGNKYLHFSLLWNKENSGWIQRIKPVEDYIFSEAEKVDWNKSGDTHSEYYSNIWKKIEEMYK